MVELVMVMVLLGILAAYVMPRFSSALSLRDDSWHDSVLSAMRYAQKGAVARRRLTCVDVTSNTITITTATSNPASSCSGSAYVTGPDGANIYATAETGSAGTTVSPSGTIYFQPDGRVTATGAANSAALDRTISMSGAASVTILGETGHVE
jgi:MSHA pilin protein MshC